MKLTQQFLHLFVPRHTNNHRAKLLHNSSILALCLSLIFAQIVLVGFSHLPQKPSVLGYAAQISKTDVISLTNQKRTQEGLAPLAENSELDQGAQAKAENMISIGYWAHVAPDGTQPWKFFADSGYKYRYAGENLARDFSSASAAVEAWMASPTHRENMLSDKYTDIGIGVIDGMLNGTDTTIIVQFFGKPMSDSQVATVTTPAATSIATVATPSPTLIPIIAQVGTPKPTVAPVEVLAGADNNRILISPFVTTRNVSAALVMILMVAFVVDIVVVSRRRISRVSGRSFAHVAFLGMTLAVVLIIQAGQIL